MRFSDSYLDRLISPSDAVSLAELQAAIVSSKIFDPELTCYGLPASVFTFVETLNWLSQSARSGAWTYFESTPESRVTALLRTLGPAALSGLVEHYRLGADYAMNVNQLRSVDEWIADNEHRLDEWLCKFVRSHDEEFRGLIA